MPSRLAHIFKALAIILLTCIFVHLLATNNNSSQQQNVNSHLVSTINELQRFGDLIQRPRYDVDCHKIINMDPVEQVKAKSLVDKLRLDKKLSLLNDSNFVFDKSKCDLFKRVRSGSYLLKHSPHTTNNGTIRIAFSILVYDQVEQFERLLHTMYRPEHYYCVHVDGKSSQIVHQAIRSIVGCFENVFVASKLENVVYAGYSRLQADINCMKDLSQLPGWSYFMNMASSEFPLRTNHELTNILRIYNGASDVEIANRSFPDRVNFTWRQDTNSSRMVRSNVNKQPVPHGFQLKKGYAYVTISRQFFNYALDNKYSQDLLAWLTDTYSPDESFWATLLFNTQLFNATGFKQVTSKIETMTRYASWKGEASCEGMWRHGICVFSAQDLPSLVRQKHFIANKLKLDYDPVAYQCMEEWYRERSESQDEVVGNLAFVNDLLSYCQFIKAISSLPTC